MTLYLSELRAKQIKELIEIAKSLAIEELSRMRPPDLIHAIATQTLSQNKKVVSEGVLDISSPTIAHTRSLKSNYLPAKDDAYVPRHLINLHELKQGHFISGHIELSEDGKKFRFTDILAIDGISIAERKKPIDFDAMTPGFPAEHIQLETPGQSKQAVSMRVLDLIAPMGFGQRALIAAPPKSGKTMLVQGIARSIMSNYADATLIMLLIDERPEEVTEMKRLIKGEVVSSTFDAPPSEHVKVAEMTLNRAKRLAESGKNVVIMMDSITRLVRAYNDTTPSSGKLLSGGIDPNALHKPKYFFGAARNLLEGGSLTIIATVLVGTESKMDELIAQELKGRGNSDIALKEDLARQNQFPALDINACGTRRDEEFLSAEDKSARTILRATINNGSKTPQDAIVALKMKIQQTQDNAALLESLLRIFKPTSRL